MSLDIKDKKISFSDLAAGIGRMTFPLARRFILTTAKHNGEVSWSESILDVVGKKQAFKNTIAATVKKRL